MTDIQLIPVAISVPNALSDLNNGPALWTTLVEQEDIFQLYRFKDKPLEDIAREVSRAFYNVPYPETFSPFLTSLQKLLYRVESQTFMVGLMQIDTESKELLGVIIFRGINPRICKDNDNLQIVPCLFYHIIVHQTTFPILFQECQFLLNAYYDLTSVPETIGVIKNNIYREASGALCTTLCLDRSRYGAMQYSVFVQTLPEGLDRDRQYRLLILLENANLFDLGSDWINIGKTPFIRRKLRTPFRDAKTIELLNNAVNDFSLAIVHAPFTRNVHFTAVTYDVCLITKEEDDFYLTCLQRTGMEEARGIFDHEICTRLHARWEDEKYRSLEGPRKIRFATDPLHKEMELIDDELRKKIGTVNNNATP